WPLSLLRLLNKSAAGRDRLQGPRDPHGQARQDGGQPCRGTTARPQPTGEAAWQYSRPPLGPRSPANQYFTVRSLAPVQRMAILIARCVPPRRPIPASWTRSSTLLASAAAKQCKTRPDTDLIRINDEFTASVV